MKAGRKKKTAPLDEKVQKYLSTYELDELNEANDKAALMQMCRLEISIEKLQAAIDGVKDLGQDSKIVKDLNTALKDATNSWVQLQTELAISRKKRTSEGDETPLNYIARLQDLGRKFLAKRLKVLSCPKCKINLGKYHVYILEKGEKGSILYSDKEIPLTKFSFCVECPICGILVEEHEGTRNS
jgi:hypothetical protein